MNKTLTLLLATSLVAPWSASAQEAPAGGSFGLEAQDYWLMAPEFSPLFGDTDAWVAGDFFYYLAVIESGTALGTPVSSFLAQIELPAGARIEGLQCLFFDADPEADAEVVFGRHSYDHASSAPAYVSLASVSSGGAIGYQTSFQALDETVRYREVNQTNIYSLIATMPALLTGKAADEDRGGPVVAFHGCRLFWRRQISPPPTSQSFNDVPANHLFFPHIEALAASGITGGCGNGNFCPNAPLTRGQMAAFLAKALGLHWQY